MVAFPCSSTTGDRESRPRGARATARVDATIASRRAVVGAPDKTKDPGKRGAHSTPPDKPNRTISVSTKVPSLDDRRADDSTDIARGGEHRGLAYLSGRMDASTKRALENEARAAAGRCDLGDPRRTREGGSVTVRS